MAPTWPVSLADRAIIITGAGAGLGRAYALAAAHAGADLVLNDRDAGAVEQTASQARAAGARAIVHVGPVEQAETGEALVEHARSAFGGPDGLIANAGIMHVTPAAEETAAAIERVVAVNVLGTMLCGVAALRAMRAQRRGAIVLVTSGARFGMDGLSSYGATKGAVASLIWSWAAEAAADGIRVNGISPFARTAMFDLNPAASGGPLPEAIAPLAVYLLSDANPMTGEIVRLDGRTLSLYQRAVGTGPGLERDRWSTEDIAAALPTLASGGEA